MNVWKFLHVWWLTDPVQRRNHVVFTYTRSFFTCRQSSKCLLPNISKVTVPNLVWVYIERLLFLLVKDNWALSLISDQSRFYRNTVIRIFLFSVNLCLLYGFWMWLWLPLMIFMRFGHVFLFLRWQLFVVTLVVFVNCGVGLALLLVVPEFRAIICHFFHILERFDFNKLNNGLCMSLLTKLFRSSY